MSTPSNVTPLSGAGGTAVPGTAAPGGRTISKRNPEVLAAMSAAIEEIIALEAERRSINESISAVREKVKSRGINMHAFRAALAYKKMDPAARDGFDDSLAIVREATGLPIQAALFDSPPQPDPTAKPGKKQH